MLRRFDFRLPQFILAIALMIMSMVFIFTLRDVPLVIGDKKSHIDRTTDQRIDLLCRVLIIVSMFQNETVLTIALLLPSIVAVAIFVYGFIGWSVRVSFSQWKGLNPDYTFVGFKHTTTFFIMTPLCHRYPQYGHVHSRVHSWLPGPWFGLAILLDQRLKGEAIFRGIFLVPMSISFIATGVIWVG